MSSVQSSSDTTWKSQTGFVWSLIGSAVGFANILSFSAQVYKNGGGAFLIDSLAPMVMGTNMLIGALALILVFQYASKEIKNDDVWKMGKTLSPYAFCLRYIAPALLLIIMFGNLMQEFQSFDFGKGAINCLTKSKYI